MLNIKKILGNNIKTLRERLNLSQEKFAEKAGIDSKMISRIETAASFTSATTISKICRAFNVTPDELLKINYEFLPDKTKDKEALISNFNLQLKDLDVETIEFLIKINQTILKNYDRSRI